jgi:hypothetical protein
MTLRLLASCLLGLASLPAAAETFYTCDTVITSLPATLTTQGVYCLTGDLATSQTSGAAITIATNNVVLDCNGYRIGGLGGGAATDAHGVRAVDRSNVTVRECSIRGFRHGVSLEGASAGGVVERNRFDQNRVNSVFVSGSGHTVRGNVVNDTGGRPGSLATGIRLAGQLHDVSDNTVSGVFPAGTDPDAGRAIGIGFNNADASVVRGNRISRLFRGGTGSAVGIDAFGSQISVEGNTLSQVNPTAAASGMGIWGDAKTVCRDNVVNGWTTAISDCTVTLDNLVAP